MIDYKLLIDHALMARKRAYAPYSSYRVGASIITKDGKIYTGCNIESASYGATICAERVAIGNAICDGSSDFVAIAVVGGIDENTDSPAFPCGICLQVMSEHCNGDFEVVLRQGDGRVVYKLSELLPKGFKL